MSEFTYNRTKTVSKTVNACAFGPCEKPAEYWGCSSCGASFCSDHASELSDRIDLPFQIMQPGFMGTRPNQPRVAPESVQFCRECLGTPPTVALMKAYRDADVALRAAAAAFLDLPVKAKQFGVDKKEN